MRSQIKFGQIRTEEAFQQLVAFAKTFNHHVGPDSIFPIFTIECGDQVIGYFNVLTMPVVFPAMHPDLVSPREFYETINALKHHFCLQTIGDKFPNGTGLMALPTDEVIEDSVFERCGFRNMKKELWQCIPR